MPAAVGPPGHATYALDPHTTPVLVTATAAFAAAPLPSPFARRDPNFVRWLAFSPDGGYLAAATDDGGVRVWGADAGLATAGGRGGTDDDDGDGGGDAGRPPRLAPLAAWPAGDAFYGAAFHPLGGAPAGPADPAPPAVPGFGAPLLALATRGHPPRLVDAATGATAASYVPLDAVAEPAAAAAVAFAGGGVALLAAVGASVRVFDVARPGRDVACLSTRKTKRGDDDGAGLAGRLACVAAPADAAAAAGAADPHLAAAGSTRGAVLLFDYRVPSPVAVLDGGHAGGVTSVAFGPGSGGARVWSAARKDASLLCWDARALAGPLVTAARDAATTNQRLGIGFDPPGGTVVSGGTGGRVSAFDAATGARVARWTAAGGGAAVAGVACHPWLPLVATGSGERVWGEGESSGGEEAGADARAADDDCALPAVCVAVWRPPYRWTDADEWRE